MDLEQLLGMPYETLSFSDSFCHTCKVMNLLNLRDTCLLSPAELTARPGFSYHWLLELTVFLNERQLLHLLQTTPGKIPG